MAQKSKDLRNTKDKVDNQKFIFNSMVKNEKVYELRIEEDDIISGIDSISLVSEPAIEINWVAFSKEKQEDFQIPDGEDDKYVELLMTKGHPEEDLINEGYSIESIEYIGKEGFATKPNAESEWDTEEYQIRYKYALSPNIKESSIISTTRDFCKHLVNKNYVWRIEEMDSLTNDFGSPAIVWRGGYNCRHVWAKIRYKKDATIVNKASVNKGKIIGDVPGPMETDVIGYQQPSTVTEKTINNPSPSTIKNLGLSKEFQLDCPKATQDVETNLKNRQKAIVVAKYGPLNPNEPNEKFWQAKADMWKLDSVEEAKTSLCGNCAAFDITEKTLDCIAKGIGTDGGSEDPFDVIEAGQLGYCRFLKFKCAAARTCDAWVVGGPIS
jgi:hypothetical protein